MGKILTGEFTSLSGDTYRVVINCANGSGSEEIRLGPSPFVTKMDDSEMIYSPLRGGSAEIEILSEDFLSDIYTENPLGTKVTFYDINDESNPKVIWTGFADPCTYNQPFDDAFEYISVSCVDGISVLNNLKWSKNMTGEEVSFAQIIDACLKLPGCFKTWYISNNMQIRGVSDTKNISQLCKIYDTNFFEPKDTNLLSDVNRAWTAYEVMSEILKFLGYVCIASGEEVYILDYDAIRNNVYTYHKFSVGNPDSSSIVELNYNFDITGEKIRSGGTQIGLSEVYDSVSVKDEFYKVDLSNEESLGEVNITRPDRTVMQTWKDLRYMWGDGFDTNIQQVNSPFVCVASEMWKGERITSLWQFWKKPNWTTYNYSYDSSRRKVDLNSSCSWADMMTYSGAYVVKFHKGGWETNNGINGYNSGWSDEYKLNYWNKQLGVVCSTCPLEDRIILINKTADCNGKTGKAGHIGPGNRLRTGNFGRLYPDDINKGNLEDCMSYPFLEYKNSSSFYFAGEGSYLLIKGQICQHDEEFTPWCMYEGQKNSKLKHDCDKKIKCEFYIWAKLQVGNMFWDGEEWTTKDTLFRIYWQDECTKTGKDDTRSNKDFYDKWYSFQNLTKFKWEYTEEAYWVPAPPQGVIGGELKFTLYCNHDMWGQSHHNAWKEKNQWDDNRYSRYYSTVYVIKNFGLEAYVTNGKLEDRGVDSDTIYENLLEEQTINPMDQIVFKVCTYDNKSISYSTVTYESNGQKDYVKYLTNRALNSQQSSSVGSEGESGLVAEEHYIYRIVNQYEKPGIVYDYHLQGVNHKFYGIYTDSVITNPKFVPLTISYDYRNDDTIIKLIEKK